MKRKLLQQYLCETALAEVDIDLPVSVDHHGAFNRVGSELFDIKYPISYVKACQQLESNKKYQYCFVGTIDSVGGRREMLEPFDRPGNLIQQSSQGRSNNKYQFDRNYYQTIAQSWFSLCPNHVGSWYLHERAWTYRFIESCFCRSIPVMFRAAPLGEKFYRDIVFFWDDQAPSVDNYNIIVEHNYKKALEYWTFTESELARIRK